VQNIKSNFDISSLNYLNSSDHKTGDDLNYVKEFFKNYNFHILLDIATAAGHFTTVFNSKYKVAVDLSFNMLKTSMNEFQTIPVLTQSEKLPFKDKIFDIVGCRIAMHHFLRPVKFFSEVKRTLKDSGFFVLIDSIVDIEDAYLNDIEYIRDKSHIRSYTINEILLFAKGFRLLNFVQIRKTHDFYEWAYRLNAKDKVVKGIEKEFMKLPDLIKNELNLKLDNHNKIVSYTDKKGIFIFEKYD
jgi:ubiquinone/menaquinone biosynthesis C-methylase UbiE